MAASGPPIYSYVDEALKKQQDRLAVPFSVDLSGAMMETLRPVWQALGALEYNFFRPDLQDIAIDRPVYVCGLARSGTTILLETLFASGRFAAHRYSDYPFVDFILLWRAWMNLMTKGSEKLERAHLDRLEITSDSPEALEEILWMGYFDHLHDPARDNRLTATDERETFDTAYRCHIRKLLFQAGQGRYLAKGNYNLTRLPYLRRLFPMARFVIAVRKPEAHIASLMKQHYLFSKLEEKNPRILRYMNRVGHMEFGLNRVPLNVGDPLCVAQVQKAWEDGREVEGWALYWDMIYRYVYDDILSDPPANTSVCLIRYEDFCANTQPVLQRLAAFCGIDESALAENAPDISEPAYYQSGFTNEERALIDSLTSETVEKIYSLS